MTTPSAPKLKPIMQTHNGIDCALFGAIVSCSADKPPEPTAFMNETNRSLPFPRFLRFWRKVYGLSQEALGERLEVSARHISRLEAGSHKPGEALVRSLAQSLQLNERDRNQLLIAAGYGPTPKAADFHSPDLRWLRNAMLRSLKALDPYPAILTDRAANILMVNRGWVALMAQSNWPSEAEHQNIYELMFQHSSKEDWVIERNLTLSLIVMAMQQNAMLTDREEDWTAVEQLKTLPDLPENWAQIAAQTDPMSSFRISLPVAGEHQVFFSVAHTVGALGPTAFVSEPQLSLTAFYPENEDLVLPDVDHTDNKKGSLSHPLLFY